MRALARVSVGLCLGLLVVLAVELLLAPPDVPMLLLAGVALVATAGFAVWVLWPLGDRPTDRRVARFIEERCPEFEDRVVSATELAESGAPTVFHDLVLADAAERLRTIDLGRVVTSAHLRRAGARGVVATAVLTLVLACGLGPISRVARTAWLYAFPSELTLEVEPGDIRLVAGQPLRVRARLAGRRGTLARTPPSLSVLDGSTPRVIRMRPTPDGYLTEFPSVTDSFSYRVRAATLRSRDYRVEALVAPRVRRIDVEYRYPPFTGLGVRVEEDGGDVFAPAGTEVGLLVHADKAIAEGVLVLGNGRRVELETRGVSALGATLVVAHDESYTVAITDTHGLTNPGDAEYLIRVTSDRAPTAQVLRPGGDREISPLEEVTIQIRADDDYQVDALELVYTVVGRPEQRLAVDHPAGASTVTATHTLYTEDLGVTPGDFITYYARARDIGYTGRSTEARSDIFFLEIRPFSNEFEEAQSQSGLGRNADELGDLAAVQKQIIVATWRLDQERDVAAVADDIRAVAAAQGELRAMAAGAVEQIRGRGPARAAGDPGPAPGNGALAAAVDAMTVAQAALDALSTETAIPPEMEALTGLLTAQAALRRRQVAMQQGGGSQSSGNQAQQDLSALFDRELRREQETNYETGTRPDLRSDRDESEALDRLRELAERQEKLNRAVTQREETETVNERRRALERLTREQQAVREQLEELAEQLAAEQRHAAPSGQPSSDREDLRRIAEQMRLAMSGLRRQNTETARERGDRALDAMRRLELRLRGDAAAERAGVLADLQLEAQQLVEAQRRVADEAGQVAADNRGQEARSRLAAEKDDLADRVDRLDRALTDLVDDLAPPTPSDRATDAPVHAARETLAREAVASRMRAGAGRLRRSVGRDERVGSGLEPDPEHQEEQSLADALGTVAGQLQRAIGQDETQQRLAAQLGAAQELRLQLQQLQAELEQRQGAQEEPAGGQSTPLETQPDSAQDSNPGGAAVHAGADPPENQGGRPDTARSGGRSAGVGESARSRREFVERLEQYPELLEELRRENPDLAPDLEQWAQHWRSVSAPGTEWSKLDFANWSSLRRNLDNALQRFEADRSRELAASETRDRVTAGPDEALPERYRRLVDQYYRSLATAPASP